MIQRGLSVMAVIVTLAMLVAGCGPQTPMPRLGGTLTSAPGLAPPTSAPGEPGPPQSQTSDAASPVALTGGTGEWPDLLFANLYERPHGSDGAYLPDLDLISAELSTDQDWIYISLRLGKAPTPGSGLHYSVEFDTDLDARPDVLVTGYPQGLTEWSARGMRVYLDPDRNVGGDQPRLAEVHVGEWDGYEIQHETAVSVERPLVSLRPSPGDPLVMQLAVSRWMLGDPAAFAWRAWAEGSVFNPGRQEYNDFHSLEAAGSPYQTSASYPSLSLVAVDNTCVLTFGFELEAPLPGYCATTLEPLPSGSLPPDDLVYAPAGRGVTLLLANGAKQAIPGGILGE